MFVGGVRVVGLVGNKANSAPLQLELGNIKYWTSFKWGDLLRVFVDNVWD